jgi:4a-hydroxytetrahydrobiopterin dehydratase
MWQKEDKQLYRQFKFKDFKQAFDFMTTVAAAAEAMNHHPKWTNEYNKVEIWLSSHSEGKVTDKDHALAQKIDKIYGDSYQDA